jgi:cytoskeletal protein CcmA (bactofilin family)
MFFKNKFFSNGGSGKSVRSEPTIIARDMTVEGNLICDGELHIDGTVLGSVRAAVCVVEATGTVSGEVSADSLYIHGQVNGPIDAGNVRIYAGSQVKGDVVNETISIEDGAYVHGSIRQGRGFAAQPAMASQKKPAQPVNGNPFEAMTPAKDPMSDNVEDLRPIRVVNPRR